MKACQNEIFISDLVSEAWRTSLEFAESSTRGVIASTEKV